MFVRDSGNCCAFVVGGGGGGAAAAGKEPLHMPCHMTGLLNCTSSNPVPRSAATAALSLQPGAGWRTSSNIYCAAQRVHNQLVDSPHFRRSLQNITRHSEM
jgi:hypothetical protein